MRLVALLFITLIISPAAIAAKYKCKDAAGNWTEAACTGALAPPPKPEDPEAKRKERQAGWEKICGNNSISYTLRCIQDHEIDYHEMETILTGPPSNLRDKAARCYLRWFKEAAGIVDARMWRHCYYNSTIR